MSKGKKGQTYNRSDSRTGSGKGGTQKKASRGSVIRKAAALLLVLLLAGAWCYYEFGPARQPDPVSDPIPSAPVSTEEPGSAGETGSGSETGISTAGLEVINGNLPGFTEDQLTTESYESYGELDRLGRCTGAIACLSTDTMPAKGAERGDISKIRPSGWKSGMGWERCHLIAWSLSDESANERNLVTGTHTMNQAMLPYEEATVAYIRRTGNHVLYEVTPEFEGEELVARGIHMRAMSVEDNGRGIRFNVYCSNITEGSTIDYLTGAVYIDAEVANETAETYVLNTRSMKFHRPDCEGVKDIYKKNRETVTAKRSDLIREGYEPCGLCDP